MFCVEKLIKVGCKSTSFRRCLIIARYSCFTFALTKINLCLLPFGQCSVFIYEARAGENATLAEGQKAKIANELQKNEF